MNTEQIERLAWDKQAGLLPAIVQDAVNQQVLMLGYMNREALEATLRTGHVTFFSRSKNRLWMKGESSGNVLRLISIEVDCDGDSLLIQAEPAGDTCHLQRPSCFAEAPAHFLSVLENRIQERKNADPDASYSRRLMNQGLPKVAQKVGEEAVETVIAALAEDKNALLNESADLLYHLLLLLAVKDVRLDEVLAVLKQR
jgi:phosphoribosyl-AMP cyclohydrolase / phosphoribosyl-ATP pyrophosphohydrolase